MIHEEFIYIAPRRRDSQLKIESNFTDKMITVIRTYRLHWMMILIVRYRMLYWLQIF